MGGGSKGGGFPMWTCPFLSFCGTFPIFLRFPEFFFVFRGNFYFSGIFPIGPFPLSRPTKAPRRNSPERVPNTIRNFLSKKVGKPLGLETRWFSFSQFQQSSEKSVDA